MKMYSEEYIKTHIGPELSIRKFGYDFNEVESYFLKKCASVGIKSSNDCTANENTYFDTMNYTSYSGMFIMHPLCFSETIFQITDAIADRCKPTGHIKNISDRLNNRVQSKYQRKDGVDLPVRNYSDFNSIVVLAGSNKVYEHTSTKKLRKLDRVFGSEVLVKPHPITTDDIISDLRSSFDDIQIADKMDDLYTLIDLSEKVYTTHISETALTSLILGKEIEPIDPFAVRLNGSFSHINRVCFSHEAPVEVLDSAFASPKSGVINPLVDKDWKSKMDEYFDYIMAQRKRQAKHYLE